MRLNIGSRGRLDGWVNIDLHHDCDIRADAIALPFRDGVFSQVLASHTLEHLSRDDADIAACEAGRVLHSSGRLCLRGPDCRASVPIQARAGNPEIPGMAHRWECDEDELDALMGKAGLEACTSVEWWPPSTDWPLAEVELVGVKAL